MAFIPVPETAQVEVNALLDNLPVQNVFHFQNDNGVSQGNLDVLTANVATWVDNFYRPRLPNTLTFGTVYGFDMSSQISLESTNTDMQGITGGEVAEQEPNNVSKLVMWNTGFRGRSARGGFHWLSFPAGAILRNTIDSGYASQMITAANALTGLGAMGPGWQLVVVSKQFNKVPRTTGAVFVIQNASLANARTGSMRGRLT